MDKLTESEWVSEGLSIGIDKGEKNAIKPISRIPNEISRAFDFNTTTKLRGVNPPVNSNPRQK